MIAPMLCFDAKGDLDVVPRNDEWVMECKLDGWRWQIHRTEDGLKSYGGRNGSDHSGRAPFIEEALMFLPVGTVLDGELVGRKMGSSVGSLLACGGYDLVFHAFDVLAVGGSFAGQPTGGALNVMGRPWTERREMLTVLGRRRFDPDCLVVSQTYEIDPAMHAAWLAAGLEGCVAKNVNSTYRPGKRSRDWLKIKPQTTAEARVIDYVMGKGASNQDRVGALKVILLDNDAETTVGWGGTVHEGFEMIGRVIEFAHHGLSKTGVPRHPVFKRTREDLEPAVDHVNVTLTTKPLVKIDSVKLGDLAERNGGNGWLRAYGAMGEKKLLKCLGELETGTGDATTRVTSRGGSVAYNLAACLRVAQEKGLR